MPITYMRLLLLLLVLLQQVAGCPPPYNNFAFLGNETHTTADLVRIALDASPAETGWMEIVTMVCHALYVIPPRQTLTQTEW